VPAKVLDGRALARELREGLSARSGALRSRGVEPRLVVVMLGEDAASAAYVRSIEKSGAGTGIAVDVDVLSPSSADEDVRDRLRRLGDDPRVHGIILQQPLPPGLSIRRIADAMPLHKDVDGANPVNQGRLAFGTGPQFVPATPAAVMLLLERSVKWPPAGREATVVGRSGVVGMPVALLLIGANATVTVAHSATAELAAHTRRAEILVVAAGRPGLITGSMIRPGATVIDVGTTVTAEGLLGDVEYAGAVNVAGEITPVPGGVGPVTNVALLRNVIAAAETLAGFSSP
jgi:methylenetetrahydrofolate dehydrogenase (NADP+)/methenyltetrahydrofolate cyclohydrolase